MGRPRARDPRLRFPGTPGKFNPITDRCRSRLLDAEVTGYVASFLRVTREFSPEQLVGGRDLP
jgi:hypothetical protein